MALRGWGFPEKGSCVAAFISAANFRVAVTLPSVVGVRFFSTCFFKDFLLAKKAAKISDRVKPFNCQRSSSTQLKPCSSVALEKKYLARMIILCQNENSYVNICPLDFPESGGHFFTN